MIFQLGRGLLNNGYIPGQVFFHMVQSRLTLVAFVKTHRQHKTVSNIAAILKINYLTRR